MHNLNPDLQHL